MTFDKDAYGSLDSFWVLGITQKNAKKSGFNYQEFDFFERFYDRDTDKNNLTSSVHKGFNSRIGREVYSYNFRIPKNQKQVHIMGMLIQKLNK